MFEEDMFLDGEQIGLFHWKYWIKSFYITLEKELAKGGCHNVTEANWVRQSIKRKDNELFYFYENGREESFTPSVKTMERIVFKPRSLVRIKYV